MTDLISTKKLHQKQLTSPKEIDDPEVDAFFIKKFGGPFVSVKYFFTECSRLEAKGVDLMEVVMAGIQALQE